MDQDLKDKIVADVERIRTTYHGRDGRFANKASAVVANRNGERLRVVRQLRSLHRKPKQEQEARDKAVRTVLRSHLAKTKATLTGALSAPGFINVSEVLF